MAVVDIIRMRTWKKLTLALFLIIVGWFLLKQSDQEELPMLKKAFIRKATYIQFGPFESKPNHPISERHSVTFATHTSPSNIHKLQLLNMMWKSSISITIWAHGDITEIVEMAYLLTETCYTQYYLSISIIVPARANYVLDVHSINWNSLNDYKRSCSQRSIHNMLYRIRSLESSANYDTDIPYPNNLLRNVALSQVKTSHVLVSDIDLIPSQNLAENILSYFHTDKPNQPYVIPVFESSHSDSNFWTIPRLVEEWKAGVVRPFYQEPCPQCQQATGYSKWFDTVATYSLREMTAIQVAYEAGYEPFFVMRTANHPQYDERFQKYGYNRLSLICELHLRGDSFAVLSHVFLIHDGFKLEEAFHSQREAEMSENYELLQKVHEELAHKYNFSKKRSC